MSGLWQFPQVRRFVASAAFLVPPRHLRPHGELWAVAALCGEERGRRPRCAADGAAPAPPPLLDWAMDLWPTSKMVWTFRWCQRPFGDGLIVAGVRVTGNSGLFDTGCCIEEKDSFTFRGNTPQESAVRSTRGQHKGLRHLFPAYLADILPSAATF